MFRLYFLTCLLVLGWATPSYAQGLFDLGGKKKAVAVEPQQFTLTKDNGPVMIRVFTFVGDEAVTKANALAEELRRDYKIDAYTFRYDQGEPGRPSKEYIEAFKEMYEVKPRVPKYKNPPQVNCTVFAGNFRSFDEGDRLLKRIQSIQPKSIDEKILGRVRFADPKTKKLRSPLASALKVSNPLNPFREGDMIEDQLRHFKMLVELNAEEKYSIYNNKSPLTIRVAEFSGTSSMKESADSANPLKRLVTNGQQNSMEIAARNAIILTEQLRDMGYEAYVFHGKFVSMVTIGGYSNYKDKKLADDFYKFASLKVGPLQLDPKTIETTKDPRPMIAELERIKRGNTGRSPLAN